ncbi:response regulator transcription factor [Mesonia ostreae]|uniref:Response regulator transcription factor n=1 Tax=Mesonia ostreae TaxID=861110 RepID=A0ABU2KI06_9FLAO|nr:response regulator transcription factor [Mesonia ostreae]MDT0294343.1 response regulator transcription factor [Mesonia ostreae]
MKILIIEDEVDMLQNMKQTFEKEGFLIESAKDQETALQKIGIYKYDCILLDIGLPDGSGLAILKILKEKNINDGVIIVSAKDSLDDKLKGLNLGADDYLPKPFHMAELNARVKALLRRRNFEGNKNIELGNLIINPEERSVFVNQTAVELNRKELDILLYLVTNKGRLVNKTALAEHVWGDHIDQADNFEFIYSQIKNLRKKLTTHQAEVEIKSIYGMGYKLELL